MEYSFLFCILFAKQNYFPTLGDYFVRFHFCAHVTVPLADYNMADHTESKHGTPSCQLTISIKFYSNKRGAALLILTESA